MEGGLENSEHSLLKMVKQLFSTKWKESKQPRKQRKYSYNAPLHLKRKELGAMLDKTLRLKYGVRSVSIRKGDTAVIMRGKHKAKKGKVNDIKLPSGKVSLEGINITKKDGTAVPVWFHASKLKLTVLDEKDKKRFKNKDSKNIEKQTDKKTETVKQIKEKVQ
jgi:large subunit ribosomal protein L24